MFKFFEGYIINTLSQHFRKDTVQVIEKELRAFLTEYPNTTFPQFKELVEKLCKEERRAHHIVHDSILTAGVARAKYVFLVASLVGTGLNIAEKKGLLYFSVPLLMAFTSLLITIGTIEIQYKLREKAAFDSVISGFKIEHNLDTTYPTLLNKFLTIYDAHPVDLEAGRPVPIVVDNKVYPFN